MNSNSSMLYKIFEYLIALLLILQCNTIFFSMDGRYGQIINIFTIVLIFILFLISILKLKIERAPIKKLLLFNCIFIVFVALLCFIEYVFIGKFSLISVGSFLISPLFFVTYLYERAVSRQIKKSIIAKFVNISLVLSIVSLIFWILSLTGFPTNVTTTINWGGKRMVDGYSYLDFITQRISIGNSFIIRNTGIFDEGPMYSYILSIAFLFQLFILKVNSKLDYFKVVILFLTIVSTVSTTGIIVSIISYLYYVFITDDHIKNYIKIIMAPIGFVMIYVVNTIFDNKKSIDVASSYSIRMNDIHACFQSWMDHLFFGVGINNNSYIDQYMYPFRLSLWGKSLGYDGLSTGLYVVLAYGGIMLAMFYLIPTIYSMFKGKNRFILSLATILLFIYTVIPFNYIYGFVLSYFYLSFIFTDNKE